MTTLAETTKAGAMGLAGAAEASRPKRMPKPADKRGWWGGTGRRKSAVARLRMKPSAGGEMRLRSRKNTRLRTVDEYFTEERDRRGAVEPLKVTGLEGKFEIVVIAHGGGYMGQAGAVRLALARALRDYDPTLEDALRANGMLTRDAREVERKKYGQAGVRRRFQFSKR